jgi:hypothetical protein
MAVQRNEVYQWVEKCLQQKGAGDIGWNQYVRLAELTKIVGLAAQAVLQGHSEGRRSHLVGTVATVIAWLEDGDSQEERVKIFTLIDFERDHQDKKWGADRNLPDSMWLNILVEELGEVAGAIMDCSQEARRKELVQVAAVAVAWLEMVGNLGQIQPVNTRICPNCGSRIIDQ